VTLSPLVVLCSRSGLIRLAGERQTATDDLVQDCIARAPAKIHLREPGTDLRAWLFAILHRQHINSLRRDARRLASIDILKTSAGVDAASQSA
jgi:DNA-directed RNA polymerase specialized sigma24 family protein